MHGHLSPSEIDNLIKQHTEDSDNLEQLFYRTCDPLRLGQPDATTVKQRTMLFYRLVRVSEPIQPLFNEYLRRGGWKRYYATMDRKIHPFDQDAHGLDHLDKFTAWLADDSGKSREAMHREYGASLCGECFPEFEPPFWGSDREILGFRLTDRHWASAGDLRIQNVNNGAGIVLSSGVRPNTLLDAQRYLVEALEVFCEAQRLWPGQPGQQATNHGRDAIALASAIGVATGGSPSVVLAETRRIVQRQLEYKFGPNMATATA